jgi:hypothetical protein
MKMQKATILLSLFIVILFTTTCKKDEDKCENPQIPGEYFPAYPNTYWKYKTNKGKTVEYKISEKYEDCKEACRPVFLNTSSCIQGNQFVDSYSIGQGFIGLLESPIYTTIIDSAFLCPHSFATFFKMEVVSDIKDIYFTRTLIKEDTSISVNSKTYNNVIIVKEIDNRDTSFYYNDFFAKNIGLIKRDFIEKDTTAINTTTIMELESYNIGEK